MLRGLTARLTGIAALGLVLSAASELWFYPVELAPDLWVMVLAYGLVGWAAYAWIAAAGRRDAAGWWLAAGWIGFLAEGVVVGELYAVPLFGILWTSLAWHALVSVHLCFRWPLALLNRPAGFAAMLSGVGIGLGLWGAWFWHAADGAAWGSPLPYLRQLWIGWAMWLAGLMLWHRAAPVFARLDLRWDAALLGVATALIWLGGWAAPYYPVSLTLPALALATALGLRRPAPSPPSPRRAVRPKTWAATVLLPTGASAAYLLAHGLRLDWPANVAAVVCLGGPAVWLWGRAVLGRGPRRGNP